jgi:hypothetical protein
MKKCLSCDNTFNGRDYDAYMFYGKCPFCSCVNSTVTHYPAPALEVPRMYMLVANAGDLEIPCRFSYDKDKLEKALTDAFPEGKWEDGSFKVEYEWEATEEDEKNGTGWYSIFVSYYDGCGGIFEFTIEEVEVDKIVCSFSLD